MLNNGVLEPVGLISLVSDKVSVKGEGSAFPVEVHTFTSIFWNTEVFHLSSNFVVLFWSALDDCLDESIFIESLNCGSLQLPLDGLVDRESEILDDLSDGHR